MEHAATGALMILPKNSAFISNFFRSPDPLVEVDVVPTFFPADPLKILNTAWSPPIFTSLVTILSSSLMGDFAEGDKPRRQKLFFQNQTELEIVSDIAVILQRLISDSD